jgi:hypothetical protein
VLKDKVARILSGPALGLTLRNRGIGLAAVTAPKQTETTPRWKVALTAEGHPLPLPTKIEFSRRPTTEEAALEPIAPSVLAEHQSVQFLAPHYRAGAALRQKVKALADRREVQARDVFDLGIVLIPRIGGRSEELRSVRSSLEEAMNRAMTLTYAEYKAQVVAYLHPDHAEPLGSSAAWEAMQLQVVEFLDKAIARERGRGHGP